MRLILLGKHCRNQFAVVVGTDAPELGYVLGQFIGAFVECGKSRFSQRSPFIACPTVSSLFRNGTRQHG